MDGRIAPRLVLSDREECILRSLARRTHCPQAIALRAGVVLAAGEGHSNTRIGRELGCHRQLAQRWRDRFAAAQTQWAAHGGDWDEGTWREKIAGLLEDRQRPGAPPTFSAQQLCQIVAIACEKPQDCGRPVTHWTPREVADEAIKRGVVASISPRHVGRFLKYGGPQAAPRALLAEQPGSRGEAPGVCAAV